jgi:hypothetical protein
MRTPQGLIMKEIKELESVIVDQVNAVTLTCKNEFLENLVRQIFSPLF